jgi:hypothetical protein
MCMHCMLFFLQAFAGCSCCGVIDKIDWCHWSGASPICVWPML